MADTKKKFGHALLQAFGLDDQRVKRLRLDIEAGDVPLLTVTVYPRDVSAQQIEAIATEYEIISRSELLDIRERLAAQQQAEPAQEPFALPCPTPKACREHCCSGHCIPRATSPQQAEPVQEFASIPGTNVRVRLPSQPHDAGSHDQRMTPAVQRVVDAADRRAPVAESCIWYQDGDSESSVYATSCHNYFHLTDGTPADNDMRWCCYCGKKLAQELIEEDGNG